MKVLYSWLKEYVDIDIDPYELEKKFFSAGFEVESLRYLGENIENVVVGRIASAERYEGTHLTICHVDCGDRGSDHLILTGADNIFEGAKVPVALVGAVLPCGVNIKPRKMVDMVSYGMLCSGEELCLDRDWYPGADADGILILGNEARTGEDIADYLELNDYLFDISVTANRPDCQSVVGIAREAAAFLDKPFREPDYGYTEDGTTDCGISVTVSDKDLCPRYLGHYVYDVKDMQSPLWMKRRLIAIGHNVINAMVDITNYVLAEIGQPMHAFDLDTLEGRSVVVRRARDGEELVTLDGKMRTLNHNNLLICDRSKAVGLAGIMGGLNSEITGQTREVLFESAKFLRDSVRRTSRGLGLVSDASSRFEKGVDEYTVECGMARALNLTQSLGVAKISSCGFDISDGAPREKRIIKVSPGKINGVLGITVPTPEMVRILEALRFETKIGEDGDLILAVPRYREDIEGYQDIAEEIIREYGYDKVVPTFLEEAKVTAGGMTRPQEKETEVKEFLCAEGYYEIRTISMTSESDFDRFMIARDTDERKAVVIKNPITENYSVMRTFMAPSMVRVIESNIKNGHDETRFFEIANVYVPKGLPLSEAPEERKILCLGSSGGNESFFTMKETLEDLAAYNGLVFEYGRGSVPYLHPGRTAEVYCKGEKIGHFGQLRYEIADGLDIAEGKKADARIMIAEIRYDKLAGLFKDGIRYVPESGFTGISRDISVTVDRDAECAALIDAIKGSDRLITKVALFDIFESDRIGEGKKSMAFNIRMSRDSGDVTDKMANKAVSKAVRTLEEKFGARIRS